MNVTNRRRVLCVSPRYARSFGTFHHAYKLMRGVRAFMPPQGILLIASYLPKQWEVRFVDENNHPATDADYEWADAVLVSGMHIQRPTLTASMSGPTPMARSQRWAGHRFPDVRNTIR